jgi:hypothetical protein
MVALAGRLPFDGREREELVLGPLGQEAEDVAQVRPRLDITEAATRE